MFYSVYDLYGLQVYGANDIVRPIRLFDLSIII